MAPRAIAATPQVSSVCDDTRPTSLALTWAMMVSPIIRYQASDSSTILAMVREGLGITLVPRQMLPQRLEGVMALPLDPPQPLPIGLAVRSQTMASRGATLFVQAALAWAQEQASLLPRTR